MTVMEFLAMGGYAFYVWTAYGITLVVLIANWVLPSRRERLVRRSIADRITATPPPPTHRLVE